MKKIFAMLAALVLALTVGCSFAVAEEDMKPSTPEMKAYESTWVSEDGETLVQISRQDDGFQITAVRKTGDDTFTSWEYLSNFDAETKSIKDAFGIKCDCKVTDGVDNVIDGSSVDELHASFTIGDDARLIWKDEEAGTETVLAKIGNFIGQFVYDRLSVDFVWNAHENHYNILATWADNAWQTWDYQLNGNYDPETETVSFQGLTQLLTYKDDGEIDTEAKVEERELEGTFSFDENGGLIWKSSDASEDGIVLENCWIPLWASVILF